MLRAPFLAITQVLGCSRGEASIDLRAAARAASVVVNGTYKKRHLAASTPQELHAAASGLSRRRS